MQSATSSSLVPGYTQVPSFDENDEEWEYETAYVTMDLGPIDPTALPNAYSFRLIGLDSPTPYLQVSGMTFKGKHDRLIGSEVIFRDGRDPADKSRRFVVPVSTTSQRVTFKKVTLEPINPPEHTVQSNVPPPVLFAGRKKKATVDR